MPSTSECARSPAGPPPDVAADTLPHSRRAFCLALKAARERRGVTIAQIAETTKVCPSHFEALERGDVRLWPKGLYRRTFFRGYVSMVGLPITETVDAFVRLFPDDASSAKTPVSTQPEPAAETLRIVLDDSWRGSKTPMMSRMAIAVIDLAVVTLPAITAAWATGQDPATLVAVTSAGYFTLATLLLGTSPAAWAMRRRPRLATMWRGAVAAPTPAPEAQREPVEGFRMGEERSWMSDARRIRPSHVPPRIRVRFRWS